MSNKSHTEGTIIKIKKLWWLKINRKFIRTSPLDGATFPYLLKIEYNVNDIVYEKHKIVYWGNEIINIEDKVIVTYDENRPSKMLKISKKNK